MARGIKAPALVAALLLLAAPGADALSITVALEGVGSLTLSDQSAGNPLGCSVAGDITDCGGTNLVGGPNWTMNSWSITTDADPFVLMDLSISNTSASVQTFTITVQELTSVLGTTTTGGSVQGGLTADSSAGTLGHNAAEDAMYQALIDGVVHQSLLAFDSSISASAFGSASLGVEDFGLPGVTLPGPSVASSIAIRTQFTLTPGDRATFSGSFVVEPVPEPGTALLLGFGLAVATLAAERRARGARPLR